jgi:hypothetical protein
MSEHEHHMCTDDCRRQLAEECGHGAIDEIVRLRAALTKIRTAGYNWDATSQWMQKVAASALEPGKWPDAGEQPAIQEGA